MSRAPDLTETGRFAGWRPVRGLTEKSNFTQTCSLLSQYIKEKGSLGDLSLGIGSSLDGKGSILTSSSSKPETMNLNLLPVLETQSDSDRNAPSREVKSMDLFPQQASFRVPNPPEDTTKKPDFRPATKEPEKAQMTIFYAGKVHVYDDFPADKAKELMVLASKGSAIQTPASGSIDTVSGKDQHNSVGLAPSNSSLIPASSTNNPNLGKDQHNSGGLAPSNSNLVPPSATNNPSQGKDQHNSGGLARSNSNLVPPSATNNPNQDRAQPQRPPQPSSSDLPIARRVSLHRFLEKRKDRYI
uniref:Protein TIFY n=1 Tax=Nelumbo nucifera TaxID=4432 RepID=A0A822ZEJ1_NELNU|nr:TPA_asm: hypothetical protein HUJ06_001537 [Nelumbo nucifera]